MEALEHRLVRDGARRALDAELRVLLATKAVLDAAPLAICTLDTDGRVQSWNPAAERVFGWSVEEAVGHSFPAVSAEERGEIARLLARTTPNRSLSGVRLERVRKDLSSVTLSVATSALLDERGERSSTVLIAEDITASEGAAREAAAVDARFRSFAETAIDAFVAVDAEGRVTFWNASAERMFGHTAEDMMGGSLSDLMPVRHRGAHLEAMRRMLKTGERRVVGATAEIAALRRTGEEFPAELAISTWRSGDEIFLGVAIRDISRRKRTEAELERVLGEYRGLIENARDPIVVFAPEGERILEANGAACAFYGHTRGELVGRSLQDFSVHPDSGCLHVTATLGSSERYEFETIQATRMGEHRHLEISASTASWNGEPAILSINRDVTERKHAEETLKQSEELLRQAQKMEAVGMLAGGIAHDFNNLLTVINGYGSMVLGQLPAEGRLAEMTGEVLRAGERAAELTRQLLAFSRRQTLRPRPLDLNTIVGELGKMLARLIGERVEIVTSLDARLGTVVADPGQVEQVILNLAVNARDAMSEGGRLTIGTRNAAVSGGAGQPGLVPGDYVMLTVRDTGCGMSAETLERVFEPFFTTKEVGKGTGLGLATVYGIVAQSGGTIQVESAVGEGTSFTIYLPRTDALETEVTEQIEIVETGSETVLLAEDDEAVRALVAGTLETLGYRVLAAGDGEEALEVADAYEGAIDLVLSDVVMPRKSGVDLARELNRRHGRIPVLLMSGYPDAESGELISDEEMRILSKPFARGELARAVREVLDAR